MCLSDRLAWCESWQGDPAGACDPCLPPQLLAGIAVSARSREKDTGPTADHKEALVALLGRVVRVSVEAVRIVEAIRGAAR
jgi:hypothetical protein